MAESKEEIYTSLIPKIRRVYLGLSAHARNPRAEWHSGHFRVVADGGQFGFYLTPTSVVEMLATQREADGWDQDAIKVESAALRRRFEAAESKRAPV